FSRCLGTLQSDAAFVAVRRGQTADSFECETIQPRLNTHALRFVPLLVQSIGNRFGDDIVNLYLVLRKLALVLAVRQFAFYKAPQPRKIRVNVARNVSRGNRLRFYGSYGLFERN